jgi:hypothetical protein
MHHFHGYEGMGMAGGWSFGYMALELLLIGVVVYIAVKLAIKK